MPIFVLPYVYKTFIFDYFITIQLFIDALR